MSRLGADGWLVLDDIRRMLLDEAELGRRAAAELLATDPLLRATVATLDASRDAGAVLRLPDQGAPLRSQQFAN